MVPYVTQPSFHLGCITIHAFGVIVASAFLDLEVARRRFRRLGLDAFDFLRVSDVRYVGLTSVQWVLSWFSCRSPSICLGQLPPGFGPDLPKLGRFLQNEAIPQQWLLVRGQ